MTRKRFSPEQIITMLREAEVLLNQSHLVAGACRKLGVSELSSGISSARATRNPYLIPVGKSGLRSPL